VLLGVSTTLFVTADSKNFRLRSADFGNMIGLMKYYLFISDELPDFGEKYNPGQKTMYLGFVPLIIIQGITGFHSLLAYNF